MCVTGISYYSKAAFRSKLTPFIPRSKDRGVSGWVSYKVDQEVLETLVKRSHLFSYAQTQLFVFSKSGFTQNCFELAKQLGNVSLVTFDDIAEEFVK